MHTRKIRISLGIAFVAAVAAMLAAQSSDGTSVGNPGENIVGITAAQYVQLSFFNPTNAPVQVLISWRAFPAGTALKEAAMTAMPGTGVSLDFGRAAGEVCPPGERCEIMGFVVARGSVRGTGLTSFQLVNSATGATMGFDPSETLIR
jgi:hypothetical protein